MHSAIHQVDTTTTCLLSHPSSLIFADHRFQPCSLSRIHSQNFDLRLRLCRALGNMCLHQAHALRSWQSCTRVFSAIIHSCFFLLVLVVAMALERFRSICYCQNFRFRMVQAVARKMRYLADHVHIFSKGGSVASDASAYSAVISVYVVFMTE